MCFFNKGIFGEIIILYLITPIVTLYEVKLYFDLHEQRKAGSKNLLLFKKVNLQFVG